LEDLVCKTILKDIIYDLKYGDVMIIDNIRNYKDYCKKGSLLEKGMEFLANRASTSLQDGRVEIDGDKCFALVQSYTTARSSEKRWECHKKYVDIQYVVSGSESIEYAPIHKLLVEDDKTPNSDVIFFKPATGTNLILEPGDFAVFFPQDGHKPGVVYDNVQQVKKIVVKVKCQSLLLEPVSFL
jgi:biofilm protein TabA